MSRLNAQWTHSESLTGGHVQWHLKPDLCCNTKLPVRGWDAIGLSSIPTGVNFSFLAVQTCLGNSCHVSTAAGGHFQ